MAYEPVFTLDGKPVENTKTLKKADMPRFYEQTENPWHQDDDHNRIMAEMFAAFRPFLPRNLRILDLGCGECYAMPTVLPILKPKAYTGIDVAATAIVRAGVRLAGFVNDLELDLRCYDYEDNPVKLHADIKNHNLILSIDSLYYSPMGSMQASAYIDTFLKTGDLWVISDCCKRPFSREMLRAEGPYWVSCQQKYMPGCLTPPYMTVAKFSAKRREKGRNQVGYLIRKR